MEERTTVEKRTTVVPEPAVTEGPGSTNVNIDPASGVTTIQTNEPVRRETTVTETTVERRTRS